MKMKIEFITCVVLLFIFRIENSFANTDYDTFAQSQKLNRSLITKPYEKDVLAIKNKQLSNDALKTLSLSSSNTSNSTKIFPPVIYVFVSFSMPETSLKQWMEQATRLKAYVVIRGLANNSFKETTAVLTKVLANDQGGLLLDPTLFQRFAIEQVPAVVMSEDKQCVDDKNCRPHFDVIYGDVTLDYALQKLREEGEYHVS